MSEKYIRCNHTIMEGACGVGVVFDFHESDYKPDKADTLTGMNNGGAGWLTAGFIHKDTVSDKAFAELSVKYKVLLKTRPRKNKNSGNLFYMAVFDTRGSGVPTGFDACDDLQYGSRW